MKFLKSIGLAAAIAVTSFTAHAQYRPVPGTTFDILGGVPLTVTTGGISNITVYIRPTQFGYAIAPYFVLTNAGTPAVAFYTQVRTTLPGGTSTAIGAPALLGTVAGNATTAVSGYLNNVSNYNAVAIQVGVSNTHTASIVVSNIFVTTYP